jgi:alpha-1,6-mannosyltransferase
VHYRTPHIPAVRVSPRLILAFGLLVEAGALTGIALLSDISAQVHLFLALFALAGAGFLLAIRAARTLAVGVPFILLLALAFRLPLLPAAPSLSDDVWRYLHDGRAQRAGVSPYAHAPADPATTSFRGPDFDRINHPDLPTIYPPVAQLAFFAAALLGEDFIGWKLILLAFEIALIVMIAATLRRSGHDDAGAVLYAWHPLAIIEVAGSAHVEPVAIAPLIAALLLVSMSRPFTAGAALGISIAAKYFALPLVFLLDRRATGRVAFGAIVAVSIVTLPWLIRSGGQIFGSLFVFGRSWESNGAIFAVLAGAAGGDIARALLASALLLVLVVLWRMRAPAVQTAFAFVFATLLLSPVVHPWYLLWLAALLPLVRRPAAAACAALTWTLLVPLAYLALPVYLAGGQWRVPLPALLAQYLPVFALLAFALIRGRADHRSPRSASSPAR